MRKYSVFGIVFTLGAVSLGTPQVVPAAGFLVSARAPAAASDASAIHAVAPQQSPAQLDVSGPAATPVHGRRVGHPQAAHAHANHAHLEHVHPHAPQLPPHGGLHAGCYPLHPHAGTGYCPDPTQLWLQFCYSQKYHRFVDCGVIGPYAYAPPHLGPGLITRFHAFRRGAHCQSCLNSSCDTSHSVGHQTHPTRKQDAIDAESVPAADEHDTPPIPAEAGSAEDTFDVDPVSPPLVPDQGDGEIETPEIPRNVIPAQAIRPAVQRRVVPTHAIQSSELAPEMVRRSFRHLFR